jgi:hypothetical protein
MKTYSALAAHPKSVPVGFISEPCLRELIRCGTGLPHLPELQTHYAWNIRYLQHAPVHQVSRPFGIAAASSLRADVTGSLLKVRRTRGVVQQLLIREGILLGGDKAVAGAPP